MQSSSILLIVALVILMVVVLGLNFYFMSKKGPTIEEIEKAAEAFSEADMMRLYNGKHAEYKKILADRKILALGYERHLITDEERRKDERKDLLKTALTLGYVKFDTVEVATPLVLADDGLHLFILDAYQQLEEHLLFDNEKLSLAKLEKYTGSVKKDVHTPEERLYTLSIPTDSGMFRINLSTASYPTAEKLSSTLPKDRIAFYAAGYYFLKMLGTQYPNLAL